MSLENKNLLKNIEVKLYVAITDQTILPSAFIVFRKLKKYMKNGLEVSARVSPNAPFHLQIQRLKPKIGDGRSNTGIIRKKRYRERYFKKVSVAIAAIFS